MLRPPKGSKVAIIVFEDLECPACAHAYPIVHAAADRYHIPIVRHDFPLQMHIWSRDAAITARYLQDKISPATAEEFRGAVFAAWGRNAPYWLGAALMLAVVALALGVLRDETERAAAATAPEQHS